MNQDQPLQTDVPPAREQGASGSDPAPKATAQSDFGVPKLVSKAATEIGRNFCISSFYLFPVCLAALSGAVGNSVRLRSRLWPGPLNAALQWLFVDQTQGRLWQAIDFIVQHLSHLQDERLRELSSVSRERLEEQIQWQRGKVGVGGGRHLDPSESQKLELRLKPLKLIRNPAPGQLADAVARSGDHALLVTYGQLGLQQMCDAAKGKWTADLLTLEQGWNGQTLVRMGRKDSDDVHLLEPAVSSLMVCSKEDLSRLLETEPLSARTLARMIPMAVPAAGGSAPISHEFSLASMVDWHALIRQTNNLREAGRRDLLPLDRAAEQLLMQYWSESQSGRPQPEQKFLTQFGPVLAAKLSLGYQLAISPRQLRVSVEAMEGAIQLTKVLLRQSATSISAFQGFNL